MKVKRAFIAQIRRHLATPIISEVKLKAAESRKLMRLKEKMSNYPKLRNISTIMVVDFSKPTDFNQKVLAAQKQSLPQGVKQKINIHWNESMGIAENSNTGDKTLYVGIGALRAHDFFGRFKEVFEPRAAISSLPHLFSQN